MKRIKRLWNIFILNAEGIGLLMILFSFGWQCLEESSNQMNNEYHFLIINEKLDAIWSSEYDDAIKSGRHQTESMFYFNYGNANNRTIKHWDEMKQELSLLSSQTQSFSYITDRQKS